MAISKAPSCEIRALVMHFYPDGIKAFGHERHDVHLGRRGKPVKKVRFMPMAKAHEQPDLPDPPPSPWTDEQSQPTPAKASTSRGYSLTGWASFRVAAGPIPDVT